MTVRDENDAERVAMHNTKLLCTPVARRSPTNSEPFREIFDATPVANILPTASPRSAEKFCVPKDGEREIGVSGEKELHVFSKTAMSNELAISLKDKAAFLTMNIWSDLTFQALRGMGSAGLIEFTDENGQTRTFLVTAKHNIYKDTEKQETTSWAKLSCQSGREFPAFGTDDYEMDSRAAGSVFLRLGDDGKPIEWAFGHDVLALPINNSCLIDHLSPFIIADQDFECEVGQKIAIISWNDEGANELSVKAATAMDAGEIFRHYGRRDDINIYCGKIMSVGKQHIEHDINTYRGCSGCFIFLTDMDQPESVTHNDFGKVIAMHVGTKNALKYNVGIKLVGNGVRKLSTYVKGT